MPGSSTPWNAPQDANSTSDVPASVQEEEFEDCFACKVTGTVALGGLGTHALFQFSKLKPSDTRGRLFMGTFSALLYAAAAYRASM